MAKKTKEIKLIKPKVLAIVGPTGSGKTNWAKTLAQEFNGKLISADSRQVYRGLDIGTAKDKTFPQALIDIMDPGQTFTVAQWQKLANDLINQYLSMKSLPIIVGGTGLYIESVLYGYIIPDLKKESLKVREELEKLSDSELINKLKDFDLDSANLIDPANRRRLIRALEVSMLSSRPFSNQKKKKTPSFKSLIIGIEVERETLYAKIDARVEQMVKEGLVEEVRKLAEKYPSDLPALNTIGYKEIIDYLQSKITLPEALQQIKFHTHDYVRRQETWFRRDKNIKWVKTIEEAKTLVKRFLQS